MADSPDPTTRDGASLLDAVPVPKHDAYVADLDEWSVVYRGGELHRLDPTGALLWQLFESGGTIRQIGADVADAFDADPERCTNDIAVFARHLAELGLVTLEEQP